MKPLMFSFFTVLGCLLFFLCVSCAPVPTAPVVPTTVASNVVTNVPAAFPTTAFGTWTNDLTTDYHSVVVVSATNMTIQWNVWSNSNSIRVYKVWNYTPYSNLAGGAMLTRNTYYMQNDFGTTNFVTNFPTSDTHNYQYTKLSNISGGGLMVFGVCPAMCYSWNTLVEAVSNYHADTFMPAWVSNYLQ